MENIGKTEEFKAIKKVLNYFKSKDEEINNDKNLSLEEIKELKNLLNFDTNIEITDKNANKGVALEAYAKEHNIKMEEVMAFGDSLNDYSMLSKDFGYTVAMGNATQKIKKTAKYITKTNDEDGVAKVIEKFILN